MTQLMDRTADEEQIDEIEDEEDEDDDLDMLAEDTTQRGAASLLASDRMTQLMDRIEELMVETDEPEDEAEQEEGVLMIMQCNEMVVDVDNEIEAISKSIRDEYAKRFPELESLILNPLDYARVVLKLGNETDLTQVDLTGILPSATIMVVTVTASTTVGTQLPPQTLATVTDSCEQVLQLSDNKQKMLAFVESRMNSVAPNVSAIVGTTIAAKLVGAAGGLNKLAEMPSTVLQILGSKKKTLGGMSTTS